DTVGAVAARGDPPAVGAEGDAQRSPRPAREPALEPADDLAGVDVPDLGPPRRAAVGDPEVGRAEGDPRDPALHPVTAATAPPISRAPGADVPIPAPGDARPAIGAEHGASDVVFMPPQPLERPAARHVPDDRRLVGAG